MEDSGFKNIKDFAKELNDKQFGSEEFWEIQLKKAYIGNYEKNGIIEDTYIGDFVFRERRIILEAYGSIHKLGVQIKKDEIRAQKIKQWGWTLFILNYPADHRDWMSFLSFLQILHNKNAQNIGINIGSSLVNDNSLGQDTPKSDFINFGLAFA